MIARQDAYPPSVVHRDTETTEHNVDAVVAGTTLRVVSGDSLWNIAIALFNDTFGPHRGGEIAVPCNCRRPLRIFTDRMLGLDAARTGGAVSGSAVATRSGGPLRKRETEFVLDL